MRQAGAILHRGARASHYRGLSHCGAQAPDAQAQQLWLTGPVAPRHVGSSQTRARTRVPCPGRQTLNHCATREAPRLRRFFWPTCHTAPGDLYRIGLDVPSPASASHGSSKPSLAFLRFPGLGELHSQDSCFCFFLLWSLNLM